MEFIILDILVFTFAVFLLLVTPGPGVLSTAGVGSGFGSRTGLSDWIIFRHQPGGIGRGRRLCRPGPLDSLREVGSDDGILRLPALAGTEDCNGQS